MTPAVSVLLPTHNNGLHLESAVQSVLAQSFGDVEVLIVDDGSRDDTPALLHRLAAQDSRIRVLTNFVSIGIERSLNLALHESQAPLLARMDADDLCLPTRLEQQVGAMQGLPEVVALGAQVETFGDVQMRYDYPLSTAETRAYALFGCPLCHPAAMIRRWALVQVGGYPLGTPYSEDYALWAELLRVGELTNLPDVLLHYRRHAGSASATRQSEAQTSARQVWASMLLRLNLQATKTDLDTHQRLRHSLHHPLQVTPQQRLAAERWAEHLIAANELNTQIGPDHLERQLQLRLQGLRLEGLRLNGLSVPEQTA